MQLFPLQLSCNAAISTLSFFHNLAKQFALIKFFANQFELLKSICKNISR